MDLGVCGGPGFNPPQILRDNLSFEGAKSFMLRRRSVPLNSVLFKGEPYIFACVYT